MTDLERLAEIEANIERYKTSRITREYRKTDELANDGLFLISSLRKSMESESLLKEAIKEWDNDIGLIQQKYDKALERERILREALELYANQDSWEWNGSIRDDGGKHSGYGLKAREALKKAEEIK